MRTRLHKLWESRSPRERTAIVVVAVAAGILLYLWFVLSASRARDPLLTAVTAMRAQAARLEQQAAEYERLRAMPPPPAPQSDLRSLLQAQAGAAGLPLTRIDAPDADQARVVLGAVAFADWLTWTAGLQSQKVRVDACRVEALSAPGLVNVTATFVRAGAR
jgi:type II secretory pathway component PulM